MKASQRRDAIVRMARNKGLASVEELSRAFDVTPSTIRRDLALLGQNGQLARTYGGAIAVSAPHHEATLQERSAEGHLAKVKWTSRSIQNGVTVVVAREVEVTIEPGVAMQAEWQGRVQSVDVAASRIVVVPRNDDPIRFGGVSLPEVTVVVNENTLLQRREPAGGGRFAIALGDIVAGEDRIWFRGRVVGPDVVAATWLRVRAE